MIKYQILEYRSRASTLKSFLYESSMQQMHKANTS